VTAKIIMSEVWIQMGEELTNRIRPQKIVLYKSREGVLMDGRPVQKIKNKWVYIPH
jgi:hypothetical protein